MSLFSKVFKAARGALVGFATGGPLGAVAGGLSGYAAGKTNLTKSRIAALPTTETFSASDIVRAGSGAVSMLPAVVRTGIGAVARRVPAIAAGAAIGSVVYDMYGRVVGGGRKRRRMNPMNARAARRAIRRIKGARKMLQQIERQLPKQRAAAPRRLSAGRGENQFIRQG